MSNIEECSVNRGSTDSSTRFWLMTRQYLISKGISVPDDIMEFKSCLKDGTYIIEECFSEEMVLLVKQWLNYEGV